MSDASRRSIDEMSSTVRGSNLTYSPSSQNSGEIQDPNPPPPPPPPEPLPPLVPPVKQSHPQPQPQPVQQVQQAQPPAPGGGGKPQRHQRKISWGGDEILHMDKPANLEGRQKSEASRSSIHLLPKEPTPSQESPLNQSYSGMSFPPTNTHNGASRPTVFELPAGLGVVNPLEQEAEACLLRAIERAASDSQPPLLPHVPDEAVAHSTQSEEKPSTGSDGPSLTRNSLASTRGAMSSRSPATFAAGRSLPRHARKPTLDQTLAGLSHAIETLNASNNMFFPDPAELVVNDTPGTVPRPRSNTLESAHSLPAVSSVDPQETAVPHSSYDTFAQNAELFYQQQQQLDAENMGFLSSFLRANREDVITEDEPADLLANDQLADPESPPAEGLGNVTIPGENEGSNTKFDPNAMGAHAAGPATISTGNSSNPSSWSKRVKEILFDEWVIIGDMKSFIRPQRNTICMFLQIVVLYIGIPSLGAAAILFYLSNNPPTGRYEIDGNSTATQQPEPTDASISYYLLFFGVRQMTTLTLAMATQLILIDFLALDRGYLFRFGARLPLFIMQARGWPFVLFFWCMYDWALLSGKHPFFAHWLYFQKAIDLFNAGNPDGGLVESSWNHTILGIATALSLAVAIKRFWMGIFLGKKTYYQYSDKLADAMKRMLLTTQVAALSRQIVTTQGRAQLQIREHIIFSALTEEKISGMVDVAAEEMSETNADESVSNFGGGSMSKAGVVIDPNDRSPLTGKLSQHQKNRVVRLLGAWEEPSVLVQTEGPISIASLMHFRRGITNLRTDFPFSASFGPAGTREDCVTSAQEVFRRLMLLSDYDDVLNFEVLALLGAKSDGSLDQDKLMELIRLFRPDRDGSLSMVNFVRSVDKVYKEIRMLRASVSNSSKVDGQFEMVFDIIFYIIVCVIILYILGIDPLALFVSLSGLAVSISFMIGTASAKYFQGVLFILLRRPYSIGDFIHINDPTTDTSFFGSACWVVEDITLYHTTVRFYFTNEKATFANGALADYRVINATRSGNAYLFHYMKLPINVANDKLEIMQGALERFIRNRPREWISLDSVRVTDVDPSLGFLHLLIAASHRENWANWLQIKTSQSDLIRFGVELTKKLDIVYEQPVLPVDVRLPPGGLGASPPVMPTMSTPLTGGAPAGLPPRDNIGRDTGRSPRGNAGHKYSYSVDFQNIDAQFNSRAAL